MFLQVYTQGNGFLRHPVFTPLIRLYKTTSGLEIIMGQIQVHFLRMLSHVTGTLCLYLILMGMSIHIHMTGCGGKTELHLK